MRRTFTAFAMLALWSQALAAGGSTASSACREASPGENDRFAASLPRIPTDLCRSTREQKLAYLKALESVRARVGADLERREAAASAAAERGQAGVRAAALKQSGLTEKEAARLENASDEETDELVDKVLRNQANMSLAEAQKLATMSEGAQKAYVAGYAQERQAAAVGNRKEIEARNTHARKMMELTKRQRDLIRKLQYGDTKLHADLKQIDDDARIKTLDRRCAEKEGLAIDDDRRQGLYRLQDEYCSARAPMYLEVVKSYDRWLQASRSDYCELDRVTGELSELQVGSAGSTVEEGTSWLKAFGEAVSLHSGVFGSDRRKSERIQP